MILPFIFIAFVLFWLYNFLTRRGQSSTIKLATGAKEVQPIGEISQDKFKTKFGVGINQKIKLYRCIDHNGEYFYVLETTQSTWGSIQRNWIVLRPDALEEVNRLIKLSTKSHFG